MTVPTTSRFQRYFTVIARWLAVSGSVFIVTYFTVSYLIDHYLTKYYAATAQIEIHNPVSAKMGITPGELETILSAEVLLPVIKDQGLDVEWGRRMAQTESLSNLEAVAHIDKMLRLATPSGTDLVNITVVDDVPKEAADIANAIAERYQALREVQAQQQTAIPSRDYTRLAHDPRDAAAFISVGALPTVLPHAFPAVMVDTNAAPKLSPTILHENPVRIVSRAEVPTTPFKPSPRFLFYVPLLAAIAASLVASSFVEVILLFVRAAEVNAPLSSPKPPSLAA